MSENRLLSIHNTENEFKNSVILSWPYELVIQFLCIMCQSLLSPAMQTKCCGQRFCQKCFQK